MTFVDEMLQSPIFWFVVGLVVFWVVLRMVSRDVFGKPIGQVFLERSRPNFKDIDANAHIRLYRDVARASKLSKPRLVRALYIQPTDRRLYATEFAGMKYVGVVSGFATYPTAHVVLFRRPWRLRKFVFFAPPGACVSGVAQRNVVYEGGALRVINQDFVYPAPSVPGGENARRLWALDWYKAAMKEMSDATLVDFAEYLLIKSGSDTIEARMAQQQIATRMERAEAGEGEYPQTGGTVMTE